ncbi:hypothetical protein FOQG_06884 [Fusarium oxysporum f. sp. raphani 54005]|uniref:Uncharacterized protein n=8 Tax=Fusarium oxysporum TaxID=5507 RepID=W9IBB1_FUSOX|nr:hypothetical protein FOXG_19012 [Fusarium oxysporum f. sp. lycopersici 4287]EWY90560.1 hypothetical protein FOYG_08038 [Fusarium oxysporum NRRL 32931]EWZ37173.1 hypothetical protein FOZG_10998 [Fusarium oxysporum Fo47]EWZ90157.1 hypothetical protein FOWG_07908 [Fusarium oxysporum f. sp. lycopersici MN25]EXA44751.1 hypothetical protein FOVG_06080 [Fusarium oxysporum f. sp. pisi HDV247]EXK39214.1 hypothetical protein FOMG_06609 [Fusarium oxysporum f. sp. melonis 26406]EXK90699.1 hypothetical
MNEHESTSGRQARQGPASSSLSLFTQSGRTHLPVHQHRHRRLRAPA